MKRFHVHISVRDCQKRAFLLQPLRHAAVGREGRLREVDARRFPGSTSPFPRAGTRPGSITWDFRSNPAKS